MFCAEIAGQYLTRHRLDLTNDLRLREVEVDSLHAEAFIEFAKEGLK